MPDYYEVLGVSRDASLEEIRRSYKDLAKVHHPDRGGNAEQFKAVQMAHEVLSDENRRRVYDMTGSDGGSAPQGGMAAGGIPFQFMGGMPFMGMPGMPGVSFDMSDILGNMFGGERKQRRGGKGPNKHHDIGLKLSDFYKGCEIKLKFNQARRCAPCSGSGAESSEKCGACNGVGARLLNRQIGPGMFAQTRVGCDVCKGEGKCILRTCKTCNGKRFMEKDKMLEIKVKPGMKEEEQIVYPGECSDTQEHDSAGDVVLTLKRADVSDTECDVFEWKGDDLWIRKRITFAESILGFKVEIPNHPNDQKPTYTWEGGPLLHGAVLQFPGGGMPTRSGFGILYIQILVQPPAVVPWSTEQKTVLESVFGNSTYVSGFPSLILCSSDSKVYS